MKVVILAGGFGSRISDGNDLRPKPMVEIGGKPILWHIMKHYAHYGYDDFIICLGYMQYVIKEYFADYYLHNSDVSFDLKNNSMQILNNHAEPWKVTLIDTGLYTMTGGRIKRVRQYIGDETFMMSYGDGVSDVDLDRLLEHHRQRGKTVTLTSVRFPESKGTLELNEHGDVLAFREKQEQDGKIINGGFMVMEPEVFDYIDGDETAFEQGPIQRLAQEGQLASYMHEGFWQCMDTQRERKLLEELWQSGRAPWRHEDQV